MTKYRTLSNFIKYLIVKGIVFVFHFVLIKLFLNLLLNCSKPSMYMSLWSQITFSTLPNINHKQQALGKSNRNCISGVGTLPKKISLNDLYVDFDIKFSFSLFHFPFRSHRRADDKLPNELEIRNWVKSYPSTSSLL